MYIYSIIVVVSQSLYQEIHIPSKKKHTHILYNRLPYQRSIFFDNELLLQSLGYLYVDDVTNDNNVDLL